MNSSKLTSLEASDERIRVCVRCRPFSAKETTSGYTRTTAIDSAAARISITDPKGPASEPKSFIFDATFGEDSDQKSVYEATTHRIVEAVLQGFNGTVFVYGQTGTGKTFTMQGELDPPSMRGIIPNAFDHVFTHIARAPERQFLVRVSFLEIYNEELRDLLAPSAQTSTTALQPPPPPLEIHDAVPGLGDGGGRGRGNPTGSVYVSNLTALTVRSPSEMMQALTAGNKRRTIASTLMNASSSRSHAIFTVTIESGGILGGCGEAAPSSANQEKLKLKTQQKQIPDNLDPHHQQQQQQQQQRIVAGRLHLVDLAGSERQSKTGAVGDRLREAAQINLSLSALGNCIAALVDGRSSHIPYRDSKLTRLLQDSLGGNSKTVMLATMSPASYNYEESLSTLRYANRSKKIKNKPTINEDPTDALLRAYQEEILALQDQLRSKMAMAVSASSTSPILTRSTAQDDAFNDGLKPKNVGARLRGQKNSKVSNEAPTPVVAVAAPQVLDKAAMDRMQVEIELERTLLLESSDLARGEKNRLLADMEKRLAALEEERRDRALLERQLQGLEAKLLTGGTDMALCISLQEEELKTQRIEKLREEEKQRELHRQLEQQQELNMLMEGEYASLQEEVDAKSRKLQRLGKRIEATNRETEGASEEWRAERAELCAALHDAARERDRKALILESFVTDSQLRKYEQRLVFDEDMDEWKWRHPQSHKTATSRTLEAVAAADAAAGTGNASLEGTRSMASTASRTGVIPCPGGRKTSGEKVPVKPPPTLGRRTACLTSKLLLSREKLVRYCSENIIEIPLMKVDDSASQVASAAFMLTRPPK